MECSFDTMEEEPVDPSRKIIKHASYIPSNKLPSSWFELRVFYVRISNCEVDGLTLEHLTVNHIPLSHDTLLEVNGARCSMYSDGVSSLLRRDRVDKKSEEATFVSTDSIRMTGSVKFEVYDKEEIVLSGVLEMCNSNGVNGESKSHSKRWSMDCKSEMTVGVGFLKGKQYAGPELPSPIIEVYIAGCFSGRPIILTKALQLSYRKKNARKGMLDSIPECDSTECTKPAPSELDLQVSDYHDYKPEHEEEYDHMYPRGDYYIEGEDGELSWFNAGVRVGVGIGLGICLGVGIGVGLLVRTYQTTSKTLRRRLV
ncbi:hypothetical protein ACHQM5_023008 [Ranunculus cassubicifolius]